MHKCKIVKNDVNSSQREKNTPTFLKISKNETIDKKIPNLIWLTKECIVFMKCISRKRSRKNDQLIRTKFKDPIKAYLKKKRKSN